jgi:two-component system sensor kinase FixL
VQPYTPSSFLMSLSDEQHSARGGVDASAQRLIRRLARRYLFVLAAVAALILLDQAVIQPWLVRLNRYAPVINTAGRQRMLSQKLTKAALALVAARSGQERQFRREELRSTADTWSTAHDALCQKDRRLGLLKTDSPEIARELADLQPQFDAILAAANTIAVQAPANSQQAMDAATSQAVRTMLDCEADYLRRMDHVVTLLEQQAGYEVFRLRAAALIVASAVIALLAGLGWTVVRPATRTIRTLVDELESRVALRTRELAEANLALRREIVEREQAEARSQHLASQLTHSARVTTLGHLTVGLAHELNQPLGAVANYAEACDVLLSREPVEVRSLQPHLEQIKQAATRASQIVRRMRDFIRPQRQQSIEADLNLLVREVTELCRAEAERAGVSVTLALSATKAVVQVDPIQIQQVLVNLIQNSLQAMQSCQPQQRRLRIRTCGTDQWMRVEVTDSGPGISLVELPSIFTPFRTTKSDGLGIGLAICRSIVERHGGEIWAEPQSGVGATLCFTLPSHPCHDVSHPEHADGVCCR